MTRIPRDVFNQASRCQMSNGAVANPATKNMAARLAVGWAFFVMRTEALSVYMAYAQPAMTAHTIPPRSYDTEFSEPTTKTTRPERVKAAATYHIGDGAGCLFRCEIKRENKGLTPIVISAAKATPVRLTE